MTIPCQLAQPAFTTRNVQSLIKTTETFLQDTNNLNAISSINADVKTAIANDLAILARVSKAYSLNADAGRLFQTSADLYAQSKNTIAQTAELKELSTLQVSLKQVETLKTTRQ